MKSYHHLQTIFAFFLLPLSIYTSAQQGKRNLPQPAVYQQKMQSGALLFIENKGQVADDKGSPQPGILFTATSGGAKIYLTANGIHYQFSKTEYPKGYDPFSKEPAKDPQPSAALRKQIPTSTHRFTMELQGANLHPTVSKQGQSSYYENYYLPQCPDGITGVHGYEKIVYQNVYPNIDWVVYSKGGFMEYDFLVHPGGNPASIRLKIKDADAISLTSGGELLMKTSLGEVKEKAPVSYMDGRIVPSRCKQNSDGTIGFAVQAQPGKELRIDPSIVWSTYYGGSSDEEGASCAADNAGNVYLAGTTLSNTGIASGGFQNNFGGGNDDAFLVKFDGTGNRTWATYYGGSNVDDASSCVVDGSGNIYIAGLTSSTNAIAANGFQNVYAGATDAFLAKFSGWGIRIWGTYYGGEGTENYVSCCLDGNSTVYLSGATTSTTGIAFSGFQNSLTVDSGTLKEDAFLAKFSNNGNRLWGTYYGGEFFDYGYGCTADAIGNVYLVGRTYSSTGIASGGFLNTHANGILNSDAFLVKFSGSGNRLWATYYGNATGSDEAKTCATDGVGNIYIAGTTQSATDIAFNGFQMNYNGSLEGFIVKFNSNGNRLWSSYYGGTGGESLTCCRVDLNGNLLIAGYTSSANNITSGGFLNTFQGGVDGFVATISSTGSLIWSSYFGGGSSDILSSCATDLVGNIFVSGYTSSATGIAANGFQSFLSGPSDAVLVKIGAGCILPTLPTISTNYDTVCTGATPTLTISSGHLNSATHWQWYTDSCGGTPVGNTSSITITPAATTTYYIRGEGGCVSPGNCVSKTIYVKPKPVVSFTALPSTICPGDTVTASFTGTAPATATYQWTWGSGIVISGSGAGPYQVQYPSAGSIDLTVSNGACIVAATQQAVMVRASPTAAFTASDTTGCFPLSISFSNLSRNATAWQWHFGNGSSSTEYNPSPHSFSIATHTVSLTATNGLCSHTISKNITVVGKPEARFYVDPPINTPVQLSKAHVQLINNSSNANRYLWRYSNGDTSSLSTHYYQFKAIGHYPVTLYAYNNFSCVDSLTLQPFIVVADSAIRIPSAFSPNKDGINDTWAIAELQGIINCRVTIFNRWGQNVFTSTGYSKPWDGTYNGKPLPVATYYYIITVGSKTYTGTVTLLR